MKLKKNSNKFKFVNFGAITFPRIIIHTCYAIYHTFYMYIASVLILKNFFVKTVIDHK